MASDSRICFLSCPMGIQGSATYERSSKLQELIVEPAVRNFGFETRSFLRPSDANERIRDTMTRLLEQADVCIADLTEANANVFFEYGWRRARGLPVLAIIQDGQKLAFDVDDFETTTYRLDEPFEARRAIERFLRNKGFGVPELQVCLERTDQNQEVCDFIIKNQPRRLDVLHLSLFTIVQKLIDALWRSPNTIVCLLLMDPKKAARYAAEEHHTQDVESTVNQIVGISRMAKHRGRKPPTVGIWYFDHEPSVAALLADDDLVQLGWYFRAPAESDPTRLLVAGHDQPGLLALNDHARKLAPKIREHFIEVWRAAKPGPEACFVGPRKDELIDEWRQLKGPHANM